MGQSSFAKSAYLNSILVPSQMNMLVTVFLHNRINLLCKITAYCFSGYSKLKFHISWYATRLRALPIDWDHISTDS